MKFNFKKFVEFGLPRIGLAAPFAVAMALTTAYFAASRIESASLVVAQQRALNVDTKLVTLQIQQADHELILGSANRLAVLAPGVDLSVKDGRLTIAIKRLEQFADWLNAVTAVQSTLPGYQWDAEFICLSVCDDSSAAKAVLKANRPRLNVAPVTTPTR